MQIIYEVPDGSIPSLETARAVFNNTPAAQEPGGPPVAPGALNPFKATVEEYLLYRIEQMVAADVRLHGVQVKITRKQGLKALARASQVGLPGPITEADIEARIAAMPETTEAERIQKLDTMTEFRNAPTWIRGNPFFESLVQAMGLTPLQRDGLLAIAGTFQE